MGKESKLGSLRQNQIRDLYFRRARLKRIIAMAEKAVTASWG